MALRIAVIVEACICVVFIAAFTTAKIRLASVADSVAQLTSELERVQKARMDAVAEVEFLRSAMQRLDATVKAANAAIGKAEEAHHVRTEVIAAVPEDWLSCPLPTGACDAFGEYILPSVAASAGSTDAALRTPDN